MHIFGEIPFIKLAVILFCFVFCFFVFLFCFLFFCFHTDS